MIEALPYSADDFEEWDAFVGLSHNGSLVHTRAFMAHHKDRFIERSLIVRDSGRLIAVMPAAEATEQANTVVSHPGLSYGGLVHAGRLDARNAQPVLDAVLATFKAQGYERFIYKSIPRMYHRMPSEDDEFALQQRGARLERMLLNCVVDLQGSLVLSSRKRRNLRRAEELRVVDDSTRIRDFHAMLASNLRERHGVSPVHSADELEHLSEEFSKEISLYLAYHANSIVAGCLVFRTSQCWHAQYIAMNSEGAQRGAVDFVLVSAIAAARSAGARYFSLGVSNEPKTGILNASLYGFKREFSGGGVLHRTWSVPVAGVS